MMKKDQEMQEMGKELKVKEQRLLERLETSTQQMEEK